MNGSNNNTGKVKFFIRERGFGFIVDDVTGREIFVHNTECKQPIMQNDNVAFGLKDGKKGVEAKDVVKLK